MTRLCQDRVAIVTGAARGIGREYALHLAAEGAKVVVNDVGASRDGLSPGRLGRADRGRRDPRRRRNRDRQWRRYRRLERRAAPGRKRAGGVRFPRRPGEQRRHPARPHARQHGRSRMGRGGQRAPQGHVRADASCRGALAGPAEEDRPTRRRAHHQHHFVFRACSATSARPITARRRPASRR